MIKLHWYFFLCLIVFLLKADDPRPEPFGNFALPTAMEPSPLFSFGQNTVDAHDALWYVNPFYIKGKNKKYFTNLLYFLYGLSDNASIFALIPVPTINKQSGVLTSGFGDVIIQGEYAFINSSTRTTQIQATIVASIYLPTGEFEANRGLDGSVANLPITGNGSTSFFLGGTYSYTTQQWYSFTSVGELITTRYKNSKIGNTLYYQAGVGRNIVPLNEQVLLLLFELDGLYSKRNKI